MTVSAVEARQHFGELLNRVLLTDEEIIIQRAGKTVAKLVKAESQHKGIRKSEGKLDFRKSRGLGNRTWNGIDPVQYVEQERQEWG